MRRSFAAIGLLACLLGTCAGAPRREAERQVVEATRQVLQMKSDPKMRELLSRAKGVLIVPNAHGPAVMMARQGEAWGKPAFYEIAGTTEKRIALILMDEKAVDLFRHDGPISLDASARNIVLWSHAEGARAGADLAASGVTFDEDATRAYYAADPRAPDTVRALIAALSD